MKARPSKLDVHGERLTEWFLGGRTLAEAQAQLRADGCTVSLGRLSQWWQDRQAALQEEALLTRIATGAETVRNIEKEFGESPAPQVETIIKLLRVLILKLSVQANAEPGMIDLVVSLTKPVLEFSKLTEKRRENDLAAEKYQRETCGLFLKWVANEEAKAIALGAGDNSGKIEQLGRLMFGEDWEEPSEKLKG